MNWITAIIKAVLEVILGIFTLSKPAETTVVLPKPEAGISDGKTEEDRRRELGY